MHPTNEVEQLLAEAVTPLPLLRKAWPKPRIKLKLADARTFFPRARHAEAALALLGLRLGDWEGAHTIAQDVPSVEGSYVHAILHRIEPDYFNANYWFRKVGIHPIFARLVEHAGQILEQNPITGWNLSSVWDPEQFSSWSRDAAETNDPGKVTAAGEIQTREISCLMQFCAKSIPDLE